MEEWVRQDDETVTVEAIRLTEENVSDVAIWCSARMIEEINPEHPAEMRYGLNVPTAAGIKRVSYGMYVIRYAASCYVMHNRPFEMQYKPKTRPAPPLESAGDSRKARGLGDPFDSARWG